MVEALLIFLKIIFCMALISLISGLIKPVYSLWFLDRMNRLKVLKIYGLGSIILFSILVLAKYYFV
jgi:hypothetical protein